MQPLDAVYLQILKNLCTDLSEPVPLDGVDPSALYRLAEKHCSLPFLLPYFEQQPQFSALKQQTKQMLLSYYQLEHFTRLTFSLLLAEKIPCFLLKGISLAANYPIPEYRKLGDLDLYIPEKDETEPARILTTIFKDDGEKFFELTVATPSIEKDDLKDAMAGWMIFLYMRQLKPFLFLLSFFSFATNKHIKERPAKSNKQTKCTGYNFQ
mgnify:CR=1 FL=1